MQESDDDDPYTWHDALFLVWIALAMFGLGGLIVAVVEVLT